MKINPLIYLILALVLLGGLFFVFKSQIPTSQTVMPSASPSQVSTSSAEPQGSKTFELVVKNKKLISGPETISVTEGDEVVIKITVDEDEELHLHGYDKSVDLEKDKPAELKFSANLTGRFAFELENSKTEIGTLEVLPK